MKIPSAKQNSFSVTSLLTRKIASVREMGTAAKAVMRMSKEKNATDMGAKIT